MLPWQKERLDPFALAASDPDRDTLDFKAEGLPAGLAVDAASGVISGTVAFGAAPSNAVTITVNDGALTAATTFGWSVTHTNRAPVAAPASITTPEDTAATLPLAIGPFLLLMNDRRYVGRHRNTVLGNAVVAGIVVIAFVLAVILVEMSRPKAEPP